MTHSLHFSGDFLCHDDPESIGPSERPISLYQAIVSIEKETWRDLARHVFGVAPDRLTADAVLRKAIETDNAAVEPTKATRREAWSELEEIIAESHQNVRQSGVSHEELERTIDETCDEVRYGK